MPDLDSITNDPDFATLTPKNQRVFMSQALDSDPDFTKLEPQVQAHFRNQVQSQFPDDMAPGALVLQPKDVQQYLGVPYKFGGDTCKGIDCSSFTQQLYRRNGVGGLPRTADAQLNDTNVKAQKIGDVSDIQPGDQLFFQGNRLGPGKAAHTGYFAGWDAQPDGSKVPMMYAASSSAGAVVKQRLDNFLQHSGMQFLAAKRYADFQHSPQTSAAASTTTPVAPTPGTQTGTAVGALAGATTGQDVAAQPSNNRLQQLTADRDAKNAAIEADTKAVMANPRGPQAAQLNANIKANTVQLGDIRDEIDAIGGGQKPAPAAAPAPAAQQFDPKVLATFRQRFLQPGDQSAPAQLAEALAKNVQDPKIQALNAAQLGKMAPVAQHAVLMRAAELAQENSGQPQMYAARSNQAPPPVPMRALDAVGKGIETLAAPVKYAQYAAEQAAGPKPTLPGDIAEQKRLAAMSPYQRMMALRDQPLRNLGRPESEMYAQQRSANDNLVGKGLEHVGGALSEMAVNPVTYAAGGLGGVAEQAGEAAGNAGRIAKLADFYAPGAGVTSRLASRAAAVKNVAKALQVGDIAANSGFTTQQVVQAVQDSPNAWNDPIGFLFNGGMAVLGAMGLHGALSRKGETPTETNAGTQPLPETPVSSVKAGTRTKTEAAPIQGEPVTPSGPSVAEPVQPTQSAKSAAAPAIPSEGSAKGVPDVEAKPSEVQPVATPIAHKPMWEMSQPELDIAHEDAKNFDKNAVRDAFGPDAAKYNKLSAIANSMSRSHEETRAASAEMERMEAGLTAQQRNRLFGIGDEYAHIHNPEDVRDYQTALGQLDYDSPDALGKSLKYAITKIGDATDPATMTHKEQLAYAQLRAGFEYAKSKGWDTSIITQHAVHGAIERFGDPDLPLDAPQNEDARMMVSRWLKPMGESVKPSDKALTEGVPPVAESSSPATVPEGPVGGKSAGAQPSGTPPVKAPWEMTRAEYLKTTEGQRESAPQKPVEPATTPTPATQSAVPIPPAPAPAESPAPVPPHAHEMIDPHTVGVERGLQYKQSQIDDPENQVSNALKGTDVYNVPQGGTWTVWRKENGDLVAVNSHHRRELASRAKAFVEQTPEGTYKEVPRSVPMRVLNEADGWTKQDVRAYGALENIRDGKGTALDATMALHDLKIKPEQFSEHQISLTGNMARDVKGLYGLEPAALGRIQSGDVPEAVGAGIGSVAGLEPKTQHGAMDDAARSGITNYAEARRLAEHYLEDQKNGTLAEENNGNDLFGGEFVAPTSTRGTRVKIEQAVARQLAGEHRELLKGAGITPRDGEYIDKEGRKVEAAKYGGKPAEVAERIRLVFDRNDFVKNEVKRLAGEIANGKSTVHDAANELAKTVRHYAQQSAAEIIGGGGEGLHAHSESGHGEPRVQPTLQPEAVTPSPSSKSPDALFGPEVGSALFGTGENTPTTKSEPKSAPKPEPSRPATEHVSVREPWQKTLEERTAERRSQGGPGTDETILQKTTKPLHRSEVVQALRDGKPVPPEVLRDYPDLAKRFAKSETPKASEAPPARPAEAPAQKPVTREANQITSERETAQKPAGSPVPANTHQIETPVPKTPQEVISERVARVRASLERAESARSSEDVKPPERPKPTQPWQRNETEFLDTRFKREVNRYEVAIRQEQERLDKTPERATKARSDSELKLTLWKNHLDLLKNNDPRLSARFKDEYVKAVKSAISKGEAVPQEIIDQYPEFTKAQTARQRYEKGLHTSFANRSVAINDDMQAAHGYKVKRQDGKPITAEQIGEVEKVADDVQDAIGPLGDVMRHTDLTIAHTNGKNPFLKEAGGLYHSDEKTISIGIKDMFGRDIKAGAHELGHWLDAEAGRAMNREARIFSKSGVGRATSYASEHSAQRRTGYDEADNRLLNEATRNIHDTYQVTKLLRTDADKLGTPEEKADLQQMKVHLGPYWREPREVFARLVEQYVATKLGRENAAADNPSQLEKYPGWWTKEQFAKMMPDVEQAIQKRVDAIRSEIPEPEAPAELSPRQQKIADIEAQMQAVRDRIAKRGGVKGKEAGSTLGPQDYADLLRYSKLWIEHNGLKFAEWSSHIAEAFGDVVRPHLEAIWAAATGKDDPHRAAVEQALKEGKSVPAEVLAEFPGLAPKAEPVAEEPHHSTMQPRSDEGQFNGPVLNEPPLTAPRNEITEAERAARGVKPEVEKQAYRDIPEAYAAGKKMVETGRDAKGQPFEPRSFARAIVENPRNLSAEEHGALAYDRARLRSEQERIEDRIASAIKSGDRPAVEAERWNLQNVEGHLVDNEKALQRAGLEWHLSGMARQMEIARDYSASRMTTRATIAKDKAGSGPVTDAERAQIKALSERIAAHESRIEDLEKQNRDLAQSTARQLADQQAARLQRQMNRSASKDVILRERANIERTISSKLSKLGAAPDPTVVPDLVRLARNYAQAGVVNMDAIVDKVWGSVEEHAVRLGWTKPELKDAILQGIRHPDAAKPMIDPDLALEKARLKQAQNQADRLLRHLAETKSQKARRLGTETANIPRAIMETGNLHATTRQGLWLSVSNPKAGAKSLSQSLSAMFSSKSAELSDALARHGPNEGLYEAMGIHFADKGIANREEAFQSQLAERIPIFGRAVKASGRAYSTGLNVLRANVADSGIAALKAAGKTPQSDPQAYRDLGRYVNQASGWGSLGKAEGIAPELNTVLYSPRFMASRLQMLYDTATGFKNYDPVVRKMALKAVAANAGFALSLIGLAKLSGATVGTDPDSSDFGKIIIGNTHIDVSGGFGPYLRMLAKMSTTGYRKYVTGEKPKFGAPTALDVATNFGLSKAAPLPSAVIEVARGKDMAGHPVSTIKQTGQNIKNIPNQPISKTASDISGSVIGEPFSPIVGREIWEMMQDQPPSRAIPLGAAAFFGATEQTHPPKTPKGKGTFISIPKPPNPTAALGRAFSTRTR